jgi:hypothetical protein
MPQDYLQKRYPFDEEGRVIQLLIPLKNQGPGRAIGLAAQISSNAELLFEKEEILLGNILPGPFVLAAKAMVITPVPETSLMISLTWTEVGSIEQRNLAFTCKIQSQAPVDWNSLEYEHPYTSEVAEGDAFVGRAEQVRILANKMLRTPMEPFYVTGQRRVGKTSLAKAAARFSQEHDKGSGLRILYLLWGEIAHDSPRASLNALGTRVARFINATFPPDRPYQYQPTFDGSLAPLMDLFNHAQSVVSDLKYALIIDEFDDISAELYLHGALADTFFSNLRAISTVPNVW